MKVSHKTIATVSTGIVLVSLLIMAAISAQETYTALESLNPMAVIAAAAVVVIGLAWFRKASKS